MASARDPGAPYPWERQLGARAIDDEAVQFRVWAPRARAAAVVLDGVAHPLTDAGFGIYETVADALPGDDYWFRIDGRELPDPCS
ncbi:MAG: hypothetical protein ACRDL8_16775, partial [Solirubrobacteraceae bacterium]